MNATRLAGFGLALLLFAIGAAAAPGSTGATQTVVAQVSPSASPEESPTPSAPEPAASIAPTPNTPAPGTIAPQGGVQNNANGPNWLDKFNRRPGPETNPGMGHMPKVMPKMKKGNVRPLATPPPR